MRVVVVGGTGHIGTYLVPRLAMSGHSVICVSRGQRDPYIPHGAWRDVERVTLDRPAEEEQGTFGRRIAALSPDAVIDLTCYRLESARHLVEALRGQTGHFLHCGTIWIHGPSIETPVTEEQPRRPISDYGVRKAAIESYLLQEARHNGFPATLLHPGHLVGQGWMPLNPAANFDPAIFLALAQGREITLPNIGMETLHHVHADDVALSFVQAMNYRSASIGESFHVVSPAALTLRGYAESVATWFGQPARLKFAPFDEWRKTVSERDGNITWDHIARSPNCSIRKAQRLIDYQPRYRSLDAIFEALSWARANGLFQP